MLFVASTSSDVRQSATPYIFNPIYFHGQVPLPIPHSLLFLALSLRVYLENDCILRNEGNFMRDGWRRPASQGCSICRAARMCR